MLNYVIRRLLYTIPILLGVMVITFSLFFVMGSRESMAKSHLGPRAKPEDVKNWLTQRGYDRPVVLNVFKSDPFYQADKPWYHSIFVDQIGKFARLDFGESDFNKEDIGSRIRKGAIPSLLVTLPAAIIGLVLAIGLSLLQVFYRNRAIDTGMTVSCVVLMSIVPMAYIIAMQALMAIQLRWFPVFGFDEMAGWGSVRFLALPIIIMAVLGLGSDVRLYRSIFLEEIAQDYVRTARAKGLSNPRVLMTHVLKNGSISLITVVVASLPLLIMGSLLIESFFGIPGLGNLVVDAIAKQDFAVVRSTVFVGSLLYLAGLILTDVCYAIADPRIRLS